MTSIDPIAAGSATSPTSINGSASPTSSLYSPASTTNPDQTMNSSMFLQLLVTQLQNQDPSNPMDTDQMVSQTTQLSMMEQLETLSSTQNQSFALQMRAAASELLGQTVSYTNSDGKSVSGTVSSISFANEIPMLTVGADQVSLDDLTGASSTSASSGSASGSTPATTSSATV